MSQCYDDFRSFIEGNEGWKKGFKSMSFEIALFFRKLGVKFFHTLETFYSSGFFSSFALKALAFRYREMYRKVME